VSEVGDEMVGGLGMDDALQNDDDQEFEELHELHEEEIEDSEH
jgi:hypothetical protein